MTDARTRGSAKSELRQTAVEVLAEALNLWELRTDPETNDVGAYLGADICENGAATVASAILQNLSPEAKAALAAWLRETEVRDITEKIARVEEDLRHAALASQPPEPEAAPGLRAALESDAESERLRDAAVLMLDTLGEYERNWRTSSTGWTPIATAKHALRAALQAQPEAPPATPPLPKWIGDTDRDRLGDWLTDALDRCNARDNYGLPHRPADLGWMLADEMLAATQPATEVPGRRCSQRQREETP